MPFPWLAVIGIKAGADLMGSYFANQAAKKQRKRDRRALGRYTTGQREAQEQFRTQQQTALGEFRGGFAEPSAAEQEYLELVRSRVEKGALPVGELTQQVGRQVGEFAQAGRAAVSGEFANIGLSGTAAAASAVGRVQAKSLQAIAEQSRAIQIENELSKIAAQRELGDVGFRQTDATRRMAEITLGVETGTSGAIFGAESNLSGTIYGAQRDISSQRAASEAGLARDVTGAISETAAFFGGGGQKPPITADGVTYVWDWKTNQYAPKGGGPVQVPIGPSGA